MNRIGFLRGSRTDRPYVSVRFSPVGRVQPFLLAEGLRAVRRPASASSSGRRTGAGPAPSRPVPDDRPAASASRDTSRCGRAARHDRRTSSPGSNKAARTRGPRVAEDHIRALDLPMKLSRVEQAFDGSRLIFYFTADSRIDFRELVRDLAGRIPRAHRDAANRRARRAKCSAATAPAAARCAAAHGFTSFEPVSIRDGQAAGPVP